MLSNKEKIILQWFYRSHMPGCYWEQNRVANNGQCIICNQNVMESRIYCLNCNDLHDELSEVGELEVIQC